MLYGVAIEVFDISFLSISTIRDSQFIYQLKPEEYQGT